MSNNKFGIPEARDAQGTNWRRAAVDLIPQPFERPLSCAGAPVCVPVVAQVGYMWRGVTPVDPLYRLAPGASHVPGCRYDVEKRAEQLRKDHHGVIDHRHGLYLLALPDVASKPTSGRAVSLGRPQSGPRQSAGIASDGRRTVAPMIAAAAAVVKLLDEFEPQRRERVQPSSRNRGGHSTGHRAAFRVRRVRNPLGGHAHQCSSSRSCCGDDIDLLRDPGGVRSGRRGTFPGFARPRLPRGEGRWEDCRIGD